MLALTIKAIEINGYIIEEDTIITVHEGDVGILGDLLFAIDSNEFIRITPNLQSHLVC